MRDIKFRAWDNENEYMITSLQGVYTALRNRMNITKQDDGYYNNGDLLKPNKGKYTLMQYTGLHDKNGKEIYEGDIVLITRPCILEKGEVKFINGCFAIKSKDTLLMLYQCEINNFKLEIIGNIYDNPDLLEKGAEDE